MVKAIARALRWREMLENGTHATIPEIHQRRDAVNFPSIKKGTTALAEK